MKLQIVIAAIALGVTTWPPVSEGYVRGPKMADTHATDAKLDERS